MTARTFVTLAQEPTSETLITGAYGFLGREVCRQFAALPQSKAKVFVATRDPARKSVSGFQPVNLDVRRQIDLEIRPGLIIHVAGEKADTKSMAATNIEGTRRLLEWAIPRGLQTFIHVSSVGSYGAAENSGPVTEDAPQHPCNEYERTKSASEAIVRELCRKAGVRYCIMQPSNVFGWVDGPRKPLLSFIRAVSVGRFRFIGAGDGMLNYISVEDTAWAILQAALNPQFEGTYILNDPASVRDCVASIAQGLGAPIPNKSIPRPLARVLAFSFETARRIHLPAPAFNAARLRELTNSTFYSSQRFLDSVGGRWSLGTTAGLAALARRYKQESLV